MAFNDHDIFGDDSSHDHLIDVAARQSDVEWARLEGEFMNAGYREGITIGKEAALQEGFDHGFEHTGASAGRELGLLRGRAAAALAIVLKHRPDDKMAEEELRGIITKLGLVRMHEIVPEPPANIAHQHDHNDGHTHAHADLLEVEQSEEQRVDDLEVALQQMGMASQASTRQTVEDLRRRVDEAMKHLGLQI